MHARAAGLPRQRADDLLMAVGELAANTLAHADGAGTLTMWTTGAEIICQVSDAGHITDPLAGRLRPAPATEGGGRGLWLVHQLCDLVQVRTSPHGTTIRVHIRLAAALRQMSELRYMDSAALQAILHAHLALGRDGGRLALVSPHDTVARVLHMTEVGRIVPVYAGVADAAAG